VYLGHFAARSGTEGGDGGDAEGGGGGTTRALVKVVSKRVALPHTERIKRMKLALRSESGAGE
jgi:hypothetical protein